MDNENTNRANMIDTTVSYCQTNSGATAGISAFAPALTIVANKRVLINTLNQVGMGTTTGVTTDTNLLRLTMETLAVKCGNATWAYANSVSNNTLASKVKVTASGLAIIKKEDVDDVCQTIHDETNTNIVAAGAFGIAAGDVTDLQTAIDLYRTATQNPRNAIISKSQANTQAKNLIRDVIDNYFAKQLDPMVKTLAGTDTNFVSGYDMAREIIDLGSTTGKIRGTVTDADDNTLNGVKFTVKKAGTQVVAGSLFTANGGKFNVADLNGDYDLSWELTGFVTIAENAVHVGPGKELKRKIVMTVV